MLEDFQSTVFGIEYNIVYLKLKNFNFYTERLSRLSLIKRGTNFPLNIN